MNTTAHLLQQLHNYQPDPEESSTRDELIDLIQTQPNCFNRHHLPAHITASAWIINQTRNQALLLNHIIIGKWLQPGGHADDNPNLFQVALEEAQQETGLTQIKPLSAQIFDIIKAATPDHNNLGEHLHYDVRFAFQADNRHQLTKEDHAAHDLKWIPLDQISQYNNQREILRMVEKTMRIS